MNRITLAWAGAAALASLCAHADDTPSETLPSVVVTAPQASTANFDLATVQADAVDAATTADTASLASQAPGAALNYNGPLAGQVQYRGLFGNRNNVLIDGMHINPGGPNWMDPPLHYLPRAQLDTLSVRRGIAPVSDGIETLGTTVNATSRQAAFGTSSQYRVEGQAMSGYSSVDDGFFVGGVLGMANDHQRFDISGTRDRGHDAAFGSGTLRDTGYSRANLGGDYGVRWGVNELGVHFSYDRTGPTGNPTFPLDTEFLHTEIGRLDYRRQLADGGDLKARLYYIHVAHAMDNFTLRPTPDFNPMMAGPDQRRVPASAYDWGLDLSRGWALWGGCFESGADVYLGRNASIVTDPQVPAFYARIFDNAQRNLYSLYSQWQGGVAPRTRLQLGARYTRVQMTAGAGGVAAGLPMPAQQLAQAFAGADRSRSDNNVDVMGRLDYRLTPASSVEFSLARKTRSPSYAERYTYIPLETTSGLADGNNYVGDIALKPEVAYEADVGLDWHTARVQLTPRLFFSRVVDYIQGLPVDGTASTTDSNVVKVSTLNGDPTPLRFSNVQAELYGADMGWRVALHGPWQVDGVVGYTRGVRLGADDGLYRVAPLHGSVRLAFQQGPWDASLQETLAASQHHVSQANLDSRLQDPATSAYALTALSVGYRVARTGTRVELGVTNLFDRRYYDALGGYNRVMGGDVPVGGRLPGYGRNVYVQLTQPL